jgi:hypothetical protein
VSARIRDGTRLKPFLCFVLIDVRCLRVPPGVCVTEAEDHCSIPLCCLEDVLTEVTFKRDLWKKRLDGHHHATLQPLQRQFCQFQLDLLLQWAAE